MSTTTQTITTPDGRELCLEIGGDPDGKVIFVHNGTPNSRHLFPSHVEDARRKGARLVCFDRPGYGGSTRREGRCVADVVEDVRTIATALGVDRVVGWGISGGGPHILACAALAPDLFAAVASLAAVAPSDISDFDFFEGMGELNIEDFSLNMSDPDKYIQKAKADCEAMLTFSEDQLREDWKSILTPTDMAALTGEVAEYLIKTIRSGMANGPWGYIDDGFAFVKPWGFEPKAITIPTQLWQGRQDQFVPYNHGAWLASQIPGVEAHLSETEGHLTLLHHVDEIHSWLLSKLD